MRVRQRQTTLVGMLRQVFSPVNEGSSQHGTTTDPTKEVEPSSAQPESSLNKGKKKTNYKGKKANMSVFKKRKPNASGPRRTSAAWDHFDKLPDSEVSESTAACKYCGKRYLCNPKQHGTSNMLAHLKTCTKYPYAVRHDLSQSVINLTSKKDSVGEDMIVVSHKFNTEECRKALASFVIIDEQPFKIVEYHGFISFCAKMQPQFVLPTIYTVARDCYQLYLDEKLRLKALLKSDCVRVALTIDCWTSIQNLNYLTMRAHFIDNDWRFNKKILCFSLIPNHEGETIGKHIDECLKDWGITAVFTITMDNASLNDVAISYLKNRIKSMNGLVLDGELLHVHCCVHILNLIVNDGLEDMHDSISSIRNAVRYVRSSPSRLAKFKNCVDFASLPSISLVFLDVPIGWNSTYLMLEAALRFQVVFEKLKEDDNSYVEYFGVSGPPSALDWLNVKVFLKFLKIFYDATKIFSGSLHITANSAFHQLALILCELKTLCASDDDSLLRTMAIEMKKKYDKYWGNVLNINPVLYFGVIFDPRYKLKYVKWSFDEMYNDDALTGCDMINRVKSNLSKLYAWYSMTCEQGKEAAQSSSFQGSQFGHNGIEKSSFLARANAFRSHLRETDSIEQKNELERYLAEGCEDGDENFDVLGWWKINSTRFPILSHVARDVLAIPISSVSLESAFSMGGRVLDAFRSSLSPKMTEALICTQNWLKPTVTTSKDRDLIDELENSEKIELELEGFGHGQPQSQIKNETANGFLTKRC